MPKQKITIDVDVPEGYMAEIRHVLRGEKYLEDDGNIEEWNASDKSFGLFRVIVPAKPRYFKNGQGTYTYRVTPDGVNEQWNVPNKEWQRTNAQWNIAKYLAHSCTFQEITEAEAMARIQPKPKPEVVCGRCGWEGGRHDVKRAEYVADHLIPVVCPQCGSRNWDFPDTRDTK